MTHNLYDKNSLVRGGCCMDAVDRIGCNIDGTVETEGHIRSVDIIIDGFRKMDNIQSFLSQEVCCFLGSTFLLSS